MLLLFNFQWSTRLSSFSRTAYILYHIPSRLSRGFSKVFQVFSNFFLSIILCKLSGPAVCYPSSRQPVYYTTNFLICQEVFQKFFEIFQSFFRDASRRPTRLLLFISPKFRRFSSKLSCFDSSAVFLAVRFHRTVFVFFPFIGFTYISCAILPDSLYIIPHSFRFVKGFFDIFRDSLQITIFFSVWVHFICEN